MCVSYAIRILVIDILVKASSQSNIDELHATADAEYGYVFLKRPGCESYFEFIMLEVSFFSQWMNFFSITTGMQVNTTW